MSPCSTRCRRERVKRAFSIYGIPSRGITQIEGNSGRRVQHIPYKARSIRVLRAQKTLRFRRTLLRQERCPAEASLYRFSEQDVVSAGLMPHLRAFDLFTMRVLGICYPNNRLLVHVPF